MTCCETKTALLDSAEALVQKVGINAMSYKHLSDEVGIRKASIHYHFPKKEDLIQALLNRCQQVYGERYRSIVAGPGTAFDKMYQLAEIYASSADSGKLCAIAMLSAEYKSLQEETRKLLDKAVQNTVKIYEEIFIQGVEKGELTSCDNTYDAAYALLSFLMGGHIIARCSGGGEALLEAAKSYIENLSR